MTFREKLETENYCDAEVIKNIIKNYCPEDFRYEKSFLCEGLDIDCVECWEREIPKSEDIK